MINLITHEGREQWPFEDKCEIGIREEKYYVTNKLDLYQFYADLKILEVIEIVAQFKKAERIGYFDEGPKSRFEDFSKIRIEFNDIYQHVYPNQTENPKAKSRVCTCGCQKIFEGNCIKKYQGGRE